METKKTYGEKLEDPRWQRKRLTIFERDEWKCTLCKDDKDTLHIHHEKYESGNPWEIDDCFLKTLCKYCHSFVEYSKGLQYDLVPDKILKIKRDSSGVFISVRLKDKPGDFKVLMYCGENHSEWEFIGIFDNIDLKKISEF